MTASRNTKKIKIESMVASQTGEPAVMLRLEDTVCQMHPDRARDIAAMLIRAAAGAEADAFIFRFGSEHVGAGENGGAALLKLWRDYQDSREDD